MDALAVHGAVFQPQVYRADHQLHGFCLAAKHLACQLVICVYHRRGGCCQCGEVIRLLAVEVVIGHSHGGYLSQPGIRRLASLLEAAAQAVAGTKHDAALDRRLILEVHVQQCTAERGRARDVVHGCALVALLRKHQFRSIQNAVVPGLLLFLSTGF